MAECSEIEAGGEVRIVKDATARQSITELTQTVNENFAKLGNRFATAQQPIYSEQETQITFSIENLPKGKYLVALIANSGSGGAVQWTVRGGWVYGKVVESNWDVEISPPFDIINHNGGNLSKIYSIQATGQGESKKCNLSLICIG